MITAQQHKLADVLGDTFLHEIPRYQRPYAWRPIEAEELFRDIQAAAAADDEAYFLGSIVLIKADGEKNSEVVDGQQRLTTLTILAAVLRDTAEDAGEKEALSETVYVQPNPYRERLEAVRILPHPEDRTFFRQTVQTPEATKQPVLADTPKNEAQKLMWQNTETLKNLVRELPRNEREQLVKYLLNKCVLVVVATETREAALRIFRVLNDRGLDLSNADVIKADLLEKFPDNNQRAHYADLWRQWENELTREGFENLLEAIRFVKEKTKNRRTLSEAYRERFTKGSATDVRDFFTMELVPAKEAYSTIVDGSAENFPIDQRQAAAEALAGLALVPNKDWIPVAVAAFVKYGPTADLVQVLRGLEGLAWAMQLSRRYDTQRLNRYVEVLHGIESENSEYKTTLELKPDEASVAYNALTGQLYENFPSRVVRAILERLDRLLAEQPVLWNGIKTVEHILPQNPSDGDWKQFSSDDRHNVTHTLGNLVLLTRRKNSSASNLDFTRKKSTYFGLDDQGNDRRIATYASVQELAHIPQWDIESYNARHKKHVGLLSNRWGITSTALQEDS